MIRVGMGYDVHRLVEGRKLVLGGVEIPYEKGLLGHSDADVLIHAVMDALLGACGERDIGVHFPPGDDSYKGISSLKLLEKVSGILSIKGYTVGNIDCTIVAEKPRLMAYIPAMQQKLGEALGIELEHISVKATTTEGLGFEGRGEGISAQAICMISRRTDTCFEKGD